MGALDSHSMLCQLLGTHLKLRFKHGFHRFGFFIVKLFGSVLVDQKLIET